MSWRTISREEFARTIPVRPPVVKRKINPSAHSMGGEYFTREPWIVASHLKTLIPVGTAMIIVAAVK